MTTGELIVVAIFGVGLLCSLSLLWWLRKLIRQEGGSPRTVSDDNQGIRKMDVENTTNAR